MAVVTEQQQFRQNRSADPEARPPVKVRRIAIPDTGTVAPPAEPAVESPQPAGGGFGRMLGAVAAGLMLAAGLYAWKQPAPVGDVPLTAIEAQTRLTNFQAHGPVRLATVGAGERAAAIRTMELPPGEQKALEQDIDRGLTRLVQITLWDDRIEDGDVVELISTGFSRVVALTKAKQTIAVPIAAGAGLQMRGVRDGGGGITVAADTDRGILAVPVMTPGQVVAVPVAP